MPVGADHQVHVVRNGSPEKLQLYNGSHQAAHRRSWRPTLDLPDLADRVADQMATQRLTIQGDQRDALHRAELSDGVIKHSRCLGR